MTSNLLSLNLQDLVKGAALAAITALLVAAQQALTQHGFDVASYDWKFIGGVVISAISAYLTKNLLSDENGAVLGKYGGTK
jgi:uncharacterized membrane protein YvlD (DUF360 family)